MSKPLDPNNGITRNPYHPRGKQIFAINMDDLRFKVDGEEIDAKLVSGAFPDVQTLIKFQDKAGVIQVDGDAPLVEAINGQVEIEGVPLSCGCGISKFMVHGWWEKRLTTKKS